ncbi:MAG: HupE/UreJ family protein, partial [Alphaproteobacteria bacterium]
MSAGLKITLAAVLWLTGTLAAAAHNRSQSFSTWTLTDTGGSVVLTVSAREVTRLISTDAEYENLALVLAREGAHTLGVFDATGPCLQTAPPQPLSTREGFVAVEFAFGCKGSPTGLRFESFFEVAPGHTNFAKLRGAFDTETLFTAQMNRFDLTVLGTEKAPSALDVARQYLWLGVTHIATGYDHLAFLLALMIFSLKPRSILLIVTGFTLGHSITLSLAALRILMPNTLTVEAVIGFTIALVAVENLTARQGLDRATLWGVMATLAALMLIRAIVGSGMAWMPLLGLSLFGTAYLALMDTPQKVITWRPVLTATFGLVHGLGFASVLLEQDLPTGNLVAALFSFNVGVELGQLVAVALILAAAA